MLRQIEPERIICYNEPFPEMQGNIIFVDYELSSWRYMNDDPYVPSKYAKYICGVEPWPEDYGIIIKSTGHILSDYKIKGMGSAYGGKWRPSKPEDKRFLGEPEILIKAEQMEKEADMIGKQRLVKMAEQQKSGTIQIMITQGLIQTHMTMI